MDEVIIKRELKASGYRWEMRGNKLFIIYTKTGVEIPLTKVGAMSLVKFIPNYLDKMRIENNKELRKKIRNIREKNRQKKVQKQIISARAKKVKHG